MKTVLITGANRGIGLALAEFYTNRGDRVIACCRKASPSLVKLDLELVEKLDVSNWKAVKQLGPAFENRKIDILINNAGVLHDESLSNMNFDTIGEQFNVNAVGALMVTKSLEKSLHEGSIVVMMSSLAGSISDNANGGLYGYRMSKAAMNAASVSLANDLKPKGVGVMVIHPGLVATLMTKNKGISTTDSAHEISFAINEFKFKDTGKFTHANGSSLDW